MQKTLSAEQVEAFYHDLFVDDQVRHFVAFFGASAGENKIVDMGGGCGFFAKQLSALAGYKTKVIDMDPASVATCRASGIEATLGNALSPDISGEEDIACFNLILHHLVTSSEKDTLALQKQALIAWRTHAKAVFVNEYIYESYLGNASGWLIYQITKSALLSAIGRVVSKVVPSLNANTFGVGVRFRAHDEWRNIFESVGFHVKAALLGSEEKVSLSLRLLLIKHIRRDSYLLVPKTLF